METGFLILGIALMGLGVGLVGVGIVWEIAPVSAPWFSSLALVGIGLALVLVGQWLIL